MDVGDLFELESTFHSDRIVISATEIDEVLGIGKSLRKIRNAFVLTEHAFDLIRHLSQFAHDLQIVLFIQGALFFADTESEHGEGNDLCGEGFGGSDAYLGSDMRITAAVRDTWDRSADDVTDREDKRAFGFRELDSCEGVGCLTGLRNSDDHIVFVDDRFAVTELRRVLHFDRYLRELFDSVHSYQSGVPRGAASGDDDSFGIEETLFVVNESREGDVILPNVDTSSHGVGQRTGLLEDLLEHEMRITAFLQLAEGEFQTLDLRCLGNVIDGGDV